MIFTEVEKIILSNIDKSWTHLARNEFGDLELQRKVKLEDKHYTMQYDWFIMYNHCFQTLHSKSSVLIADALKGGEHGKE